MKRFAILVSVAAVFVSVTAVYYLSYRLSGQRQEGGTGDGDRFVYPGSGRFRGGSR